MFYTGIGARSTPAGILSIMTRFAYAAEKLGYTLRSGGAKGADSAFEAGVIFPINKEIYLPWPKFNDNTSILCAQTPAAFAMAAKYHPAWDKCSDTARKFHARNCYQILGLSLTTPVNFVVCWTPEGKVTGGTGQALRIAIDHDIHIFNLALEKDLELLRAWWKEASCDLTK